MPINDDISDALIRHQIGLQRLSNANVRNMVALLKRVETRVSERLLRADLTLISRRRAQKLLADIQKIVSSVYTDATGKLHIEIERLSRYEVEYQLDMFKRVIPIELDTIRPSPDQVLAAVNSRPFQGRILRDWFTELDKTAFARIRDVIRQGIVEGRTTAQVIRDIRGTAALGFRDGIAQVNRNQAATAVRTALAHTSNVARSKLYQRNSRLIEGVQWLSTLDNRTTFICMSRDGNLYPTDKGPRPPAHPNCLAGDSLVLPGGRVTGASERWFKGELVTIRTGGGREIRATPNHPILTAGGWKPAGKVDVFDNLVCVDRLDRPSAFVNAGDQDIESRIEDIARSFFGASDVTTMPVPISAPDFHGDGAGSKVAIIGADGGLRAQIDAANEHHGLELAFEGGHPAFSPFSRFGPLAEFVETALNAAHGVVSRCGQALTLGRRRTVHASLLLRAAPSERNPGLQEYALDRTWADADFIRDPENADALGVSTDNVVSVDRRDFRGHVFNLETEKSVYASQGIVTHNCRSTTTPVLKSWRAMGLKGLPGSTRASMNGQVSADLTYGEWLRKQNVATQNEVLGIKKGRLFRSGNLAVDRFVNDQGRAYTLDELEIREAEAWQKAFG